MKKNRKQVKQRIMTVPPRFPDPKVKMVGDLPRRKVLTGLLINIVKRDGKVISELLDISDYNLLIEVLVGDCTISYRVKCGTNIRWQFNLIVLAPDGKGRQEVFEMNGYRHDSLHIHLICHHCHGGEWEKKIL